MDPNQQPNQALQPDPQPVAPPTPAESNPFATPTQPISPTLPSNYNNAAPEQSYDPNYLDSIAPPPPRAAFFSGSFGKIFYIMIGVFVLAVSLIIAFSGKDKTADLQETTVRITNFGLIVKTEAPYFKSNKLNATDTSFGLILTDAQTKGKKLLDQAGVQKSQYDKTMVKTETALSTKLTNQFEDARLNAQLDSVYASTMAHETAKLITLLTTMSKRSGAAAIRTYAKTLVDNLTPIQKSFDSYVDDGN